MSDEQMLRHAEIFPAGIVFALAVWGGFSMFIGNESDGIETFSLVILPALAVLTSSNLLVAQMRKQAARIRKLAARISELESQLPEAEPRNE